MKILAKIDSTKLIVEATTDELANVLGYSGSYQMESSRERETFEPGKVYNISESYYQLRDFAGLKGKLLEFSKQLATFSDTLKAGSERVPVTSIKVGTVTKV